MDEEEGGASGLPYGRQEAEKDREGIGSSQRHAPSNCFPH